MVAQFQNACYKYCCRFPVIDYIRDSKWVSSPHWRLAWFGLPLVLDLGMCLRIFLSKWYSVTTNGSEWELEVKPLYHWLDQTFQKIKWRFDWYVKCRVSEEYKISILVIVGICAVTCFVFLSTKAALDTVVPRSVLTTYSAYWDRNSHYDLMFFFFKGEIWFKRRLISTSLLRSISIKAPSIAIWSM